MAEVSLRDATKRFGTEVGVADLSIAVADGELVVLLGPTGAGKTTTLRLVAGLERPDKGEVRVGQRDVTAMSPAARDVAFVFQQYSLYPHMSAYDNMAFPLRAPVRRVTEGQIKARVAEIAELLRIDHRLANKATQLSGGEMQRVAIGRALVREPAAYLMDEPLSSLDAKLRAELRLELKRIQQKLGATILYVTHDHMEAMTMADRIGVLREGRLTQLGTPREVYESPVDIYVASRLGSPAMNLLPCEVAQVPGAPNAAVTVGARTEHVKLALAKAGFGAGTVQRIEHLGDQNHIHVSIREHALVTLADPHSGLSVGDAVDITFESPLFFDREGQRL